MPKQIRSLTGGIDTDSAFFSIDKDALLNCVNLKTTVGQSGHNANGLQFIEGTQTIPALEALLPVNVGYVNKIIGVCKNEKMGIIYWFVVTTAPVSIIAPPLPANASRILAYNTNTGAASVIISDSEVNPNGIHFAESQYISCRATDDELFWTKNDGDGICYLNLNRTYYPAATYGLIDISQLTLITEPPIVPLVLTRGSLGGAGHVIQTTQIQGSYYFINEDNHKSVLAPYSLTSLPTRKRDINIAPDAGNVIQFSVPFEQKIPSNWKEVGIIAHYPDSNTSFIIKQYRRSNTTDLAAINAHNASTTHLSLSNWSGVAIGGALDASYAVKPFDNIPITTGCIELEDNRLFAGNNLEGYDTPTTLPTITYSANNYTTVPPSYTATQLYVVMVQDTSDNWQYAFCLPIGTVMYVLCKEGGTGYFKHPGALYATGTNYYIQSHQFQLPTTVSRSALIPMTSSFDPGIIDGTLYMSTAPLLGLVSDCGVPSGLQGLLTTARYKFVSDAIKSFIDVSSTSGNTMVLQAGIVHIEDDPAETGLGAEVRAFIPSTTQNIGIQYFDSALRKCSVAQLASFQSSVYDFTVNTLTKSVTVVMPPTVATGLIPPWAAYYAITLTKNQSSARVLQFVSDRCKALYIDNSSVVTSNFAKYLTTPTSGLNVYGIGIPISSVVKYGYGYAYGVGDYINYSIKFQGTVYNGSSPVKAVWNGYIVVQYISGIGMENMVYDYSPNIVVTYSPSPLTTLAGLYYGTGSLTLATNTYVETGRVLVTLFMGTADTSQYEVAKMGTISGGQFGAFYDTGTLTTTINGECHTQSRTSETGGLTCVSNFVNETSTSVSSLVNNSDYGRPAPLTSLGQNQTYNVRFSNVNIPSTNTNGYASFDSGDYVNVDRQAGKITYLLSMSKGVQEGGQMLILCANNSFTALTGQQQIFSSNQSVGITTSAGVLGNVNQIRGNFGCISPRSVTRLRNYAFWVDVINSEVIQFSDDGAHSIITQATTHNGSLFNKLISRCLGVPNLYNNINAGVNPYSGELYVNFPSPSPSAVGPLMPTTNMQSQIDPYSPAVATYIYDYAANKWRGSYGTGGSAGIIMENIGNSVYSYNSSQSISFYKEFVGPQGESYNGDTTGTLVIPFNEAYPATITPLTLIVSANRPPDDAYVCTLENGITQIAQVSDWKMREGEAQAAILRNRLTGNPITSADFDASGLMGERLKGKVIVVILRYNSNPNPNGGVLITSVGLDFAFSSGHLK